jgi:hypothetical protein
MKYFSIETVVNAYKGFQDCMTNKSWGYLAILKGCQSSIRPLVPYEVDMDIVSNFLEDIFNLSQTKRSYDGGRSLYVVFSNIWDRYFNDQGRYSPDIFDVIVWAYRRRAFTDNVTNSDIINIFAKEFNIPSDIIENSFNTRTKDITFTHLLYTESQLKSELSKIGVDVTRNNIDAKKGGVVASPGEISRGPFVQTLYAGLDITDYVLILQSDYYSLYGNGKDKSKKDNNEKRPLQQIFYGAPGTGKSNIIKRVVDEQKKRCHRTTFHPDSDYSTFVGAYKPTMKTSERIYSPEELTIRLKEIKTTGTTYPCHKFAAKYWESLKDLTPDSIKQILNACGFTDNYSVEIGKGVAVGQEYLNNPEDGKIIYTFCPQAFTNAYVEAWNTEEDVYLVIEEINRGNCAQIFGDLFQLLDRKNGVSEYPVEADADLQSYLNKALAKTTRTDIPDDVKSGKKLELPSNLYIWATMNTSDQSLFPIDSAFKRRWEWKYIKIKEGRDENGNKLDWKVNVKIDDAGEQLSWWAFIQKINEIIASMTSSADKQLGYFFCCAKDGVIDEETFVSKVIFYLWNDVFKDYGFEDASLFRYKETIDGKETEKDLTFPDFYDEDGEKVNTERLTDFVKKVMNWKKTSEENG